MGHFTGCTEMLYILWCLTDRSHELHLFKMICNVILVLRCFLYIFKVVTSYFNSHRRGINDTVLHSDNRVILPNFCI